jgi:hypothetical protein
MSAANRVFPLPKLTQPTTLEFAPEGHLRRTPVQVWTHPGATSQDVSILAEQKNGIDLARAVKITKNY